jgi:outer membrane protein TolC
MLAFALITVIQAGAQERLGLEDAVKLALANNARLAQSGIALDAAKRAMESSWNSLLPNLTLGAGTRRANEGSVSSTASVSAGLTLSTATIGAMQTARAQNASAELAYETARRDVELAVRKAYYSIVLARDSIGVIERSISTSQKNYDQTEAKRKAGMAPELDSLTALVALEKLKPALASARVSYENQLASFKQMIGLGQERALTISDGLENTGSPLVDADAPIPRERLSSAGDSAPGVASLGMSLALARARRDAAERAVYSPSLTLSLSYVPTWSESPFRDTGSASATVSMPLDNFLPWSPERQAVAAATESIATLESQLAEAKTTAGISAQSLARKIEQSSVSVKALKLSVTLAERGYALMEDAYRFGTKDVLNVQSASDSLQSARMQVLSETFTLISAVLDLEYALGVPFGTLGR